MTNHKIKKEGRLDFDKYLAKLKEYYKWREKFFKSFSKLYGEKEESQEDQKRS